MNTSSYGSPADRSEQARLELAAATNARYRGLASAVDRLRSAGFALSVPVQMSEWTGDMRHGSFVQIDAMTCALHVGRGSYITVDIQRDLNGITPSEAKRSMLCRTGVVREPDSRRGYSAA